MRNPLASFLLIAFACACGEASAAAPTSAVVRHVAGDVRLAGKTGGASGASGASDASNASHAAAAAEVKAGDLLDSGSVVVTGADGAVTVRFHPDLTRIEVAASSRVTLEFPPGGTGDARRVRLHAGAAAAHVPAGEPLVFEDAHATVWVPAGRVACATGADGATVYVLEGEARVGNRATGATDLVGPGGKAVAAAAGTIVTRADARELAAAGLRQNLIEIDFWNPATEEYRTLEVEYEARPGVRAP